MCLFNNIHIYIYIYIIYNRFLKRESSLKVRLLDEIHVNDLECSTVLMRCSNNIEMIRLSVPIIHQIVYSYVSVQIEKLYNLV